VEAFTLIVPPVAFEGTQNLSTAIDAAVTHSTREFPKYWKMTGIKRVGAGILPGPIASLVNMDDIQVAQLYGHSDQPGKVTKRDSHNKAGKFLN
jgi:hypothetical protein